MIKIMGLKFVKKASQWCLTTFGSDGKQKQEWFDTEEQALKRIEEHEKSSG